MVMTQEEEIDAWGTLAGDRLMTPSLGDVAHEHFDKQGYRGQTTNSGLWAAENEFVWPHLVLGATSGSCPDQ